MFLKWFGQIFASCDCQFKYPGCLKAIQLEDAYDSNMGCVWIVCVVTRSSISNRISAIFCHCYSIDVADFFPPYLRTIFGWGKCSYMAYENVSSTINFQRFKHWAHNYIHNIRFAYQDTNFRFYDSIYFDKDILQFRKSFHRHHWNKQKQYIARSFAHFNCVLFHVKWLRIKFQNFPNDRVLTQTENHFNAFHWE